MNKNQFSHASNSYKRTHDFARFNPTNKKRAGRRSYHMKEVESSEDEFIGEINKSRKHLNAQYPKYHNRTQNLVERGEKDYIMDSSHRSQSRKQSQEFSGFDALGKKRASGKIIYNEEDEESNDDDSDDTMVSNKLIYKPRERTQTFDGKKRVSGKTIYNEKDEESNDDDSDDTMVSNKLIYKPRKRIQTFDGKKRASGKTIYNEEDEESNDDDSDDTMVSNKLIYKARERNQTFDGKKKASGKTIYNEEDEESNDNNSDDTIVSNKSDYKPRERTRNFADKEKTTKERKKRIDPFGRDLIKKGRISRPKSPYFIARIRHKRLDELHIPNPIIKFYKLNLPETIILRDSAGRKWTSNYGCWANGRRFYHGGWKELCHVNYITEQDLCLCQFLMNYRDDRVYIQVQKLS